MEIEKIKRALGCLMTLGAFITTALWMTLLWQILGAAGVDQWVWIVFWIYVPLGFINTAVATLYVLISGAE